jgi:uncharacterized membrane protein YheB (UPF0754 family)
MQKLIHWAKRAPATALIAAALVTVLGVTAGAMVTAKTASDHFATAALGKLGGNPQEVLNKIADSVVKKMSGKNGALSDAQNELIDKIAAMAGQKLDGVDPNKMLNEVKGQVVAAGLGKLNGIDPQVIINKVTQALVAQAMAEVNKVNLNALVGQKINGLDLNAIVRDQINKIDVNKLVKEELDKVDLNALITQVVQQKLGTSQPSLLGALLGGR